jgi:uncharacterized protein YjiS (DUF1127 family)
MLMNLLQGPAGTDGSVSVFTTPSHVRHATNRGWIPVVGLWIERSRQRRALANLDDRLLDDVGISRSEARREIAKPFWL